MVPLEVSSVTPLISRWPSGTRSHLFPRLFFHDCLVWPSCRLLEESGFFNTPFVQELWSRPALENLQCGSFFFCCCCSFPHIRASTQITVPVFELCGQFLPPLGFDLCSDLHCQLRDLSVYRQVRAFQNQVQSV